MRRTFAPYIDEVFLISDELDLVSADELDAFAQRYNGVLPPGYREYLTRFGSGDFCNELAVLPPSVIDASDFSGGFFKYFEHLWPEYDSILRREQAVRSIYCGHTYDGWEILFCADDPEAVYGITGGIGKIVRVEGGFFDPLACCFWNERPRCLYFEPDGRRAHRELHIDTRLPLAEFVALFEKRWNRAPVLHARRLEEAGVIRLLVKAIGGDIQFSGGNPGNSAQFGIDPAAAAELDQLISRLGHPAVHLQMSFDAQSAAEVDGFLEELQRANREP